MKTDISGSTVRLAAAGITATSPRLANIQIYRLGKTGSDPDRA